MVCVADVAVVRAVVVVRLALVVADPVTDVVTDDDVSGVPVVV